jgi:hypothetical protein
MEERKEQCDPKEEEIFDKNFTILPPSVRGIPSELQLNHENSEIKMLSSRLDNENCEVNSLSDEANISFRNMMHLDSEQTDNQMSSHRLGGDIDPLEDPSDFSQIKSISESKSMNEN